MPSGGATEMIKGAVNLNNNTTTGVTVGEYGATRWAGIMPSPTWTFHVFPVL